MNPKFYALLTLSLVATVTLPVVNGKLSSLVPAVIAQNTDARKAEAARLLQICSRPLHLQPGGLELKIMYCQGSVEAHRQIKDTAGEARSTHFLSLLYLRKEAESYITLCLRYIKTEQYSQAISAAQKTIEIARRLKDRELENRGLILIDSVRLDQSRSEFISLMRQVLIDAKEYAFIEGVAVRSLLLGRYYHQISRFQEALKWYENSLKSFRQINDRQGEAISLSDLGSAYLSLGQYQKAIDFHQQSLTIAREIGDRRGEAASLGNLGIAYGSLGQYQKAIDFHQQSLTIAREIGDRQREAASLGNLGSAYLSLGQYQKAIEYHQQSLAINRANREISQTEEREFRQTSSVLASGYENLTGVRLNFDNQIIDIIQREIVNRRGEAVSLGNLGIAYYSLGQYQKAIDFHQQSLTIAREIGDRKREAASLGSLGSAYLSLGQYQKAINNLEASLNITLKTRSELSRDHRKDFLASNERTVITLAEVLIQQNQPEKAFEWLNLATTADLADYNRLIDAKVADPDAQKALDNWNTDNQQLEGMRRQIQDKYSEELAQQIRQFEEKVYKNAETIGQKYPEIAELFETKPTDIAQLQKNIAPDTLVIQPVPLRDKVALFLVTREKLIVIQSDAKADDFNQLVSQYRTQLADYKNADYLVTGSKLYEILIRPIESQIATSSPKNIAIIATGQLRYIPFETLYDKKNDQVLLEKYPIYYLTRISTSSLATQKTKTDRSTLKALALANPKPFLFDTEKKEKVDLKGTEIEAETISKIFPGSEKYIGTNATLDIFKKQAFRFSILHLGTHGCFDLAGCPNLGMQANTILFANKEQYNIADAALLGLKNTELITLSACQTAKEANADGQEISGLAYVLERAGAKSVIASLWNAEDNTSAEIMTQFYQNLKNGMSKSEAMRQAKLSQIKSHPYFWSPFILIGSANYEEGRF